LFFVAKGNTKVMLPSVRQCPPSRVHNAPCAARF